MLMPWECRVQNTLVNIKEKLGEGKTIAEAYIGVLTGELYDYDLAFFGDPTLRFPTYNVPSEYSDLYIAFNQNEVWLKVNNQPYNDELSLHLKEEDDIEISLKVANKGNSAGVFRIRADTFKKIDNYHNLVFSRPECKIWMEDEDHVFYYPPLEQDPLILLPGEEEWFSFYLINYGFIQYQDYRYTTYAVWFKIENFSETPEPNDWNQFHICGYYIDREKYEPVPIINYTIVIILLLFCFLTYLFNREKLNFISKKES